MGGQAPVRRPLVCGMGMEGRAHDDCNTYRGIMGFKVLVGMLVKNRTSSCARVLRSRM
jgi:hypothetical protein